MRSICIGLRIGKKIKRGLLEWFPDGKLGVCRDDFPAVSRLCFSVCIVFDL